MQRREDLYISDREQVLQYMLAKEPSQHKDKFLIPTASILGIDSSARTGQKHLEICSELGTFDERIKCYFSSI